jgi:putative transposase
MADRVVPVDVRAMVVAWPEDAPRGAVTQFVAEHGVSRSWFYEVRKRARTESVLEAMGPRPRSMPVPHPQATPLEIEELAVRLRKELADAGWDHGPVTVRHRLLELGIAAPSRATLARIFTRHGMVEAQPQKRPRSSYRRFEADLVHECWQLDAFEWRLTDQSKVAIFQVLDDHSRYMIASHVAPAERSEDAVVVVAKAIAAFQVPSRLLTDNGTAFNRDRLGVRTQLVAYLEPLGCKPITGRPGHPQTQGKDERVHATTQRWLTKQGLVETIEDLQTQIDQFDNHYNHRRPHQALQMRTPAAVVRDDPHALPPLPSAAPPAKVTTKTAPVRIHERTVDHQGLIRIQNVKIMIGLDHINTRIHVLVTGRHLALFDHQGNHFRSLDLVAGQIYYGNGQPRGWPRKPRPSTMT